MEHTRATTHVLVEVIEIDLVPCGFSFASVNLNLKLSVILVLACLRFSQFHAFHNRFCSRPRLGNGCVRFELAR